MEPSPEATTSGELSAGRIVGVFGLRGECKIDSTRIGNDALAAGMTVNVGFGDGSQRPLRLRSVRLHKGRPLAAFDGYDDATTAAALIGATIAVARADVALAADEYLDADLVGCRVVGAGGVPIGDVVGVEHYPAQDMLVVGAARTLIPLVGAFIRRVDVVAKRIEVDVPPGLIDETEADLG